MNISNALTLFRIFLSPLIVLVLLVGSTSNRFAIALAMFVIACFTDYLDGKFARLKNQTTDFGKIADPLADKILIIPIFLCFLYLELVPFVPVLIIILREILITAIRFFLLGKNKMVTSANFLGKIKTIFQITFVIFVLLIRVLSVYISLNLNIFYMVQNILLWVTVILSLASGANYIRLNWKFFGGIK